MGNLTTKEIYTQQYPSTTLTDDQIDTYIGFASEAIESYCNRHFGTDTYSEWHWTSDDNVVILNEYPVTSIQGIAAQMAQYAQINVTNSNDVYSVDVYRNEDDSEPRIVLRDNFGANTATFIPDDYATLSLLVTALSSQLSAWGATVNQIVDTRYTNVNVNNIFDYRVQQGGQGLVIEILGFDMDSQLNWTIEADREVILSTRFRMASNRLMVQYTGGYILPAVLDYGTLPKNLIDVCNRMVNDITNQDSGAGTDLSFQKEVLGNASVTNWGYGDAIEGTYLTGLANRYRMQLERYIKKDCGFY
jgi:hypothetical protein